MANIPIPIPEGSIKIKLSYIFTCVCIFVGIGISYGEFRSNNQILVQQVKDAQTSVESLRGDLNRVHQDIAILNQSLQDLKTSLDSKRK